MPHAYWRLSISANNVSSNTSIAEVEMRATVGGADQCSGGTASASGSIGGGFVASSAVDNNTTTMWNTGGSSGIWWQYQFASPVEVGEYTIRSRHDGFPGDAPRDWTLAYSDDGSAWTTVQQQEGHVDWASSQVRTFPVGLLSGSAHHTWRLTVTANNGGTNTTIGEMQLRATIGGADQATGGYGAGQAPLVVAAAAAFDDTASTCWAKTGVGWLQYQHPTAFTVAEYAIQARSSGGAVNEQPRDWTLAYSDDGLTWTTVDTRTAQTGWIVGETRTYAVTVVAAPVPQPQMQVVA